MTLFLNSPNSLIESNPCCLHRGRLSSILPLKLKSATFNMFFLQRAAHPIMRDVMQIIYSARKTDFRLRWRLRHFLHTTNSRLN